MDHVGSNRSSGLGPGLGQLSALTAQGGARCDLFRAAIWHATVYVQNVRVNTEIAVLWFHIGFIYHSVNIPGSQSEATTIEPKHQRTPDALIRTVAFFIGSPSVPSP